MVLERTTGVVLDLTTIEEYLLVDIQRIHTAILLLPDITINGQDSMSMRHLLSRWEDHLHILLGNATSNHIRNIFEDSSNTLRNRRTPLNRSMGINLIHEIQVHTVLDMNHLSLFQQVRDSILLLVVLTNNIIHETIQSILHQTIMLEQQIIHLVEAFQRRLIGTKRRNERQQPKHHQIQTRKKKTKNLAVEMIMSKGETHP
mmetsp:Transcript_1100/g.1192  ORF Transcript_1100/g.1192 Transcript_1100/m.1192 type:complete len:202 (+) Transcript_1100:250-855(+)